MSDLLPKIIAAARARSPVLVVCLRPDRLAKELRKHLPHHDILVDKASGTVTCKSRLVQDRSCSSGPACGAGSLER